MSAFHYHSHTGRDGRGVVTRARRAGYGGNFVGENIACGYPDAAAVVDGWMTSPGHRANILRPEFREIGVAAALDDEGTPYWVQVFGTRF